MAISDIYANSAAAGGGAGTSGDPYTLAEALANGGASVRINLQPGTFSMTTTDLSFTSAGDDTGPQIIRGVDGSDNPFDMSRSFGGTGLLDTTGWPVISFTTGTLAFNQANTICEGGILIQTSNPTAGSADYPLQVTGADCAFFDLKVESTYTGTGTNGLVHINTGGDRTRFRNCEFDLSAWTGTSAVTGFGIYNQDEVDVARCRFIGNGSGGTAIYGIGNVYSVRRTIIYSWDQGIHNQDAGPQICAWIGNTIYDCDEAFSSRTTLTGAVEMAYNLVHFCGKVYDKETAVELAWLYNNAAGSITSADGNVGDFAERNRVSLTADPFINAAIGDFRPNMRSGGGLELLREQRKGNMIGALPHPQLAAQGLFQGLVA